MSILFVALFFSFSYSADKKQLQSALAAVEVNLKTPAGKQFDSQFGAEFMNKYRTSLKECKQSLPAGTKIEPFDMFLKLKTDGTVSEVLVYPSRSLRRAHVNHSWMANSLPPPHDDYWVNLHMQLN